jgi:arginine decarboxylase-like protein
MNANGKTTAAIDMDVEIRRLAADHRLPPLELPASAIPFEQKTHDLMHQNIDQVCADWIRQLQEMRKNSERLENMVLEQATRSKHNITQLYELGKTAAAEAQRGEEVNQKLMREIETLHEPKQ